MIRQRGVSVSEWKFSLLRDFGDVDSSHGYLSHSWVLKAQHPRVVSSLLVLVGRHEPSDNQPVALVVTKVYQVLRGASYSPTFELSEDLDLQQREGVRKAALRWVRKSWDFLEFGRNPPESE